MTKKSNSLEEGLRKFNIDMRRVLNKLVREDDYWFKFNNGKKIYRVKVFLWGHYYLDGKGNFYDVRIKRYTKYFQDGYKLPVTKEFFESSNESS